MIRREGKRRIRIEQHFLSKEGVVWNALVMHGPMVQPTHAPMGRVMSEIARPIVER